MTSCFLSQSGSVSSGLITPVQYVRRNHVNKDLLDRLGLETSLKGHRGCVNCLEWNHRGTLLASGSDDFCIIIWNPFERRNIFTMHTGHAGNIFSVKFLPNVNEYLMVTGAADAKVRVHDVRHMETRHIFSCHHRRIKRLANVPAEPYLFWSASEDGTVRQFDLRDPSQAGSAASQNVLVDLHPHIGSSAEAKCLAVNPLRPEMVAVGGNDQYVRVYDRRKLRLCAVSDPVRPRSSAPSSPSNNCNNPTSVADHELTPESVRYLAPGNLPLKQLSYHRGPNIVNVTCVSFSPDGQELLANMSGGQLYLFTLNKHVQPYWCTASSTNSPHDRGLIFGASSSDRSLPTGSAPFLRHLIPSPGRCRPCYTTKYDLDPSLLEDESLKAARLVKAKAFVAAVVAYNVLLERWPDDPQLYTGRATALLQRNWVGDVYNALLDCQTTLNLTKTNSHSARTLTSAVISMTSSSSSVARDCIRVTAFLLSVHCMVRLHWFREARATLDRVQADYSYLVRPSPVQTSQSDVTNATATPLNGTAINGHQRNGFSWLNTLETVNEVLNAEKPNLHEFFCILNHKVNSLFVPPCDVKMAQLLFDTTQKEEDIPMEEGTDTVPADPDFFASSSNSASNRSPSPQVPENSTLDELLDSLEDTVLPSMDPADHWDEIPPEFQQCSCFGCVTSSSHLSATAEVRLRSHSSDYTKRYLGHCNVITDIKEANFFGSYGEFIVGGSDCGSFFVWNRETTNIVRILEADSSTVNCVQPHPSICLLASSGIDSVVRIWGPRPEDDPNQSRVVKDHIRAAERNQLRSTADPMEIMLLNMGYRVPHFDFTLDRRRRSRRRDPQSTAERSQTDLDRTRSSSPSQSEGEPEPRTSNNHPENEADDGAYLSIDELDAMFEDELFQTDPVDSIALDRMNSPQRSDAANADGTSDQPNRSHNVPRRRERGRASRAPGSRRLPKRLRSESSATSQPTAACSGSGDRDDDAEEEEEENTSGSTDADRGHSAHVLVPRILVTLRNSSRLLAETPSTVEMAEDDRQASTDVSRYNDTSEEANDSPVSEIP
ncbi:unnamed protein product [Dicrocoelium dendriticum]|nr:unnamed protein product [Dicrocoelium dendriticum]